MRAVNRLLVAAAALLLIPVFWLPLWSIRIVAPQYREGLGLFIGLRDIWGQAPHDLQNINILNHYIGMKPIIPADVNLLVIMPWVVAGLIGSGLLAALVGRAWAVRGWLAAFAVAGLLGLWQFRAWNHDYGTNLSPDAPIKVPGMTYEPPVFGTKQLLNMTTHSYPSWGAVLVGAAFLLGLAALRLERRRRAGRVAATAETAPAGDAPPGQHAGRHRDRAPAPGAGRRAATAALALALALSPLLASCARQAPAAGADAGAEWATAGEPCAYCDGVIADERFGGELVTRHGAVYRFMSIECLAGFVLEGRVAAGDVATMRVVDYNHGEALIDVGTALFVRSAFRQSPNGLSLLATSDEKVARNLHFFFGGERLAWDGVLAYVRQAWSL
jgi:copper chaperone NosL